MAIGSLIASVCLALCTVPELEAQSALLRPKTEAGLKVLENAIARGAEARVEDERFTVLPLRTEGIDLANRAQWIETMMNKIILLNIDFRDESPQDCLEFFRRTTHRALVRMGEQDTHIHFLRLGASEQNHRIVLAAKDTTLRKALEQLSKQLNSTVVVTDYGIVIKEQMKVGAPANEDPFEAKQEWKMLSPTSIPDGEFAELYAKAAAGDGEAAYAVYVAISFRRNKAPEGVSSTELLKQAAEAGVLEAQCSYYSHLMRSPATREGAVKWLELAAKKGFKPAIEGLESHEELLELYNNP